MSRLTSENQIVEFLRKRYPANSAWLKRGIGDDAAIMRLRGADEYLAVTTDMLLEEIDFRRDWTTPRRLGYKSIAVNLSDLAAMGARPRFYTVSLAIPSCVTERWIREFYEGLTECGGSHGAAMVGGDLSNSKSGMLISITALGESLNRKVIYRSGGRPGDLVYVTGILGRSAAGLKLLEAGITHPRSKPQREALRVHQRPEPRCNIGEWLAQSKLVHCMMDLSDGLSMDLPRLCAASRVDAEINPGCMPLFADSQAWNCDPLELALHGGEDYELLFAVPKSKSQLLENSYPKAFPSITRIGALVRGNGGVWISGSGKKRRRLAGRGFDHFAKHITGRRRLDAGRVN